ncbi:MAG: hypothetical protein HY043_06160 [Verrucomicrobia bacterium]|nr:hypothetical protein [Verrucomicrobiota bacterium]
MIETDAGHFFTKLRGAAQGTSTLVAEIIVAVLAEALGLRVPRRVLITFDDGLVSDDRNDELADILNASRGCNLGFEFLDGAYDVRLQDLHRISHETASTIVWLDGLVMNPDRTVRNPNLLVHGDQLWLIDHGAALGFHHDWPSVTEDSPRRPMTLVEPHVLVRLATKLEEIDELLAQKLSRAVIHAAIAEVPDDFLRPLLPSSALPDAITRRRTASYSFLWKRLKPPRIFSTLARPLESKLDLAPELVAAAPSPFGMAVDEPVAFFRG